MSTAIVWVWGLLIIFMAIFGIARFIQVNSECDGVVVRVYEFGDGLACIEEK